jgi:hypothetical protein
MKGKNMKHVGKVSGDNVCPPSPPTAPADEAESPVGSPQRERRRIIWEIRQKKGRHEIKAA